MLALDNITFRYNRASAALAGITATIGPGIHLLLGENGAGKTTLLKVMAGILPPQNGRVLLDNRQVSLHRVATMSSLFFLPENMEVPFTTFNELERLHSPLYPTFDPGDFRSNLSAFGLDGSERLADCSLGTRRKGLIAYALALHTPLLMMDEPANGLDINSRKALRAIMARCVAPEQTVIVSTHTFNDLLDLYDGLILLHGGRLQICRPTYELASLLECVSTATPLPEALYWELSGARYHSLIPNRTEQPGTLDFSLLYSALMSTAAPQVLEIINSHSSQNDF